MTPKIQEEGMITCEGSEQNVFDLVICVLLSSVAGFINLTSLEIKLM